MHAFFVENSSFVCYDIYTGVIVYGTVKIQSTWKK